MHHPVNWHQYDGDETYRYQRRAFFSCGLTRFANVSYAMQLAPDLNPRTPRTRETWNSHMQYAVSRLHFNVNIEHDNGAIR